MVILIGTSVLEHWSLLVDFSVLTLDMQTHIMLRTSHDRYECVDEYNKDCSAFRRHLIKLDAQLNWPERLSAESHLIIVLAAEHGAHHERCCTE